MIEWKNEMKMNPDSHNNCLDPRYWRFSLDELALIDLPAMIQYILNVTYTGNQTFEYK